MSRIVWLSEAFALALTFVLLITPLVIRSAALLKLYDAPDGGRKAHDHPVPRVGGVPVFLGGALVCVILFIRTQPLFVTPGLVGEAQIRFLAGAFIGASLLFLTGLVDDVRGLSAGSKAVAQIVAAGVAIYFGAGIDHIALGYGQGVSVGIVEIPLTLLWIVGVTNAFNFIDGLNGLATGIAVVACAAMFVAGLVLGNFMVLLPAAVLCGALLGFLHFNFPKGNIFLGDSGSLSVGFLLAVLSLQASTNKSGAVLVILPVLGVFVPLMDGALAIIRRWLRHVPLSGADARHIHHRLLALGISPSRTVVVLWLLAAGMAGLGLLMALTAPFVATSIAIFGLVGVAVLLIYGTNLLSYHELMVAGEVLMSAPSRARRVISDQILALDLTGLIHNATSMDDVALILSEAGMQFGFFGMELSDVSLGSDRFADRVITANWAWKLDYPIRIGIDGGMSFYVLSIWCSPEQSTRPYGAERVARILGPALQHWCESHLLDAEQKIALGRRPTPAYKRRLRIQ